MSIGDLMRAFLEREEVSEERQLSEQAIQNEIKETEGDIRNQKLWALGSEDEFEELDYQTNIANLTGYIGYLKNLLHENKMYNVETHLQEGSE